jgi:hypothetical protein
MNCTLYQGSQTRGLRRILSLKCGPPTNLSLRPLLYTLIVLNKNTIPKYLHIHNNLRRDDAKRKLPLKLQEFKAGKVLVSFTSNAKKNPSKFIFINFIKENYVSNYKRLQEKLKCSVVTNTKLFIKIKIVLRENYILKADVPLLKWRNR